MTFFPCILDVMTIHKLPSATAHVTVREGTCISFKSVDRRTNRLISMVCTPVGVIDRAACRILRRSSSMCSRNEVRKWDALCCLRNSRQIGLPYACYDCPIQRSHNRTALYVCRHRLRDLSREISGRRIKMESGQPTEPDSRHQQCPDHGKLRDSSRHRLF